MFVSAFCAHAQLADTLGTTVLDKSVITQERVAPILKNFAGISGVINTEKINAIPSLLGYSDPIRFVRLLPSVQLNTELEGGIHMQGSESAHTMVAQEGVPIYGATHLLGLFSVFNTPHYKGMNYGTTAGNETRLGGLVDLHLQDSVARRFGADLSVGLLSAQGTFDIPMGKSSLRVSARRTYINLLYGNFLKYEDFPFIYGFTDANLTWTWRPGKRDCIQADFFGSLDNGALNGGMFEKVQADWFNALGAIHWNHFYSDASFKQTVYATASGLYPQMVFSGVSGSLNSQIIDIGYKNTYKRGPWEMSSRLAYYRIQPQNPRSQGYYSDISNTGDIPLQHAFEAQIGAWYTQDIGYWLRLRAGLGINAFRSPEGHFYWGPTPEVKLQASLQEAGDIELGYGLRRQNLFQVGLTNMGLPCEFWVAAGDIQAPQRSHNFTLSYNVELFDKAWSISAEAYYHILRNQLEYVGSILDIFNGTYSLENSTLKGKGRAYGFNLMIQRQKGALTGWISYAFGRSLRTFDGVEDAGEFPSNHERLHELDFVISYDGGRWDVGATFVLASGTPYTRPESLYVVGSRMICQYERYNASRLPTYMRADFSANWYFRRNSRGKSGINFSIYNILGNENAISYGLHITKETDSYVFRPFVLKLRFLPSLSVFYAF